VPADDREKTLRVLSELQGSARVVQVREGLHVTSEDAVDFLAGCEGEPSKAPVPAKKLKRRKAPEPEPKGDDWLPARGGMSYQEFRSMPKVVSTYSGMKERNAAWKRYKARDD